jgi:hypothetical protein
MGPSNATILYHFWKLDVRRTHNYFVNYIHATGSNTTVTTCVTTTVTTIRDCLSS